jgi:hypothetical protein
VSLLPLHRPLRDKLEVLSNFLLILADLEKLPNSYLPKQIELLKWRNSSKHLQTFAAPTKNVPV